MTSEGIHRIMRELPDIVVYLEALEERVIGAQLESVRISNPFVLRSVTPALKEAEGRQVIALSRLGKRIVIGLEGDLFLVVHLMIAGRLHWKERGALVQRIVNADNEANYCPRCQTGGRVLADRSLSRLLHDDWPRSIEELEARGLGVRPGTTSARRRPGGRKSRAKKSGAKK